jgi:predicted dehydrogenase
MERLDVTWEDVPLGKPEREGRHALFGQLLDAVATGGKPLCAGEDGRDALEVVNAIILSSFRKQPVSLPVDRGAYDALLEELRQRAL